jgi:hypothetical protein
MTNCEGRVTIQESESHRFGQVLQFHFDLGQFDLAVRVFLPQFIEFSNGLIVSLLPVCQSTLGIVESLLCVAGILLGLDVS